MVILENEYNLNEKTVITLGKFDGLHEGHRKLIQTTIDMAKKLGYKSLVYTFNQNPRNVLNGEEIENLISKEEKIKILKLLGIDYIVFQDFTYEFSQISPEKFVKEIIKKKLNAKNVVVGFNYRFGKEAKGNIDLLKLYGEKYEFEIQVIEPIKRGGKIISSSLIREENKEKVSR